MFINKLPFVLFDFQADITKARNGHKVAYLHSSCIHPQNSIFESFTFYPSCDLICSTFQNSRSPISPRNHHKIAYLRYSQLRAADSSKIAPTSPQCSRRSLNNMLDRTHTPIQTATMSSPTSQSANDFPKTTTNHWQNGVTMPHHKPNGMLNGLQALKLLKFNTTYANGDEPLTNGIPPAPPMPIASNGIQ